MPWTPTQFASRHNHSLHGERAAHASRIANAVLRSGVPEGESIAVANRWAQHHRADGGYTVPTRSPARERAAEVLSRGRGQSSQTDLNLTPMQPYGAPGGNIDTRPQLDWLPQQMGPDTTRIQPPMNSNRTANGGRRAAGGPAPQAPSYQTAAPNVNAQGFVPIPQSGTINLDLTNGALTPGSQSALQSVAQRGLTINPNGPGGGAAAAPMGSPGVPGIFGPTPGYTPPVAHGDPNETDAQSQAWFQQYGGSGGSQAAGGRVRRRAGGGGMSSPSMDFPSWTRMQARGEDTHPSGLIPGMGGGRQDNIPMNLPQHSHVIPADVVSGWGQGAPDQGAVNIEHALHSGPFGTGLPKVPSKPPRGLAPGRMPRLARGGRGDGIPTMVSKDEVIIPPADVYRIGGGDYDKGHAWLDRFILHSRKQIISHLRKLPPPVKG